MKIIFLLFPYFLLSQIFAKVIVIKDGDTIVVLDSLNNQLTLRLAEVDCPEKGQAFGKNAKQFISDCIFGKTITYQATDTDRYGRTIAKVFFNNGKYLSEEIIKAGLGWWYFKYSKNTSLGKLQNQAKEKKLGLWLDKNPIPPWEYRKNTN